MKIKDLPKDQNLQDVQVILPEHIYEASSLPMYDIENVPVYLVGWLMGDFFVKLNKKDTQVYPMFWDFPPSTLEEWEIAS